MIVSRIKISPFYSKVLIRTISVIALIIFVLYMSLKSLVLWLNSNSGGTWLNSKISDALTDAPYSVELSKFRQSGFWVSVENLKVTQADKLIIESHNTAVKLSFFALLHKTLKLKLAVDELSLNSLPNNTNNASKISNAQTENFDLSSLYFKQLKLYTNIKKFKVSSQVMDLGEFQTALQSTHHIKLDGNWLKLQSDIQIIDLQSPLAKYLPKQLVTSIDINVKSKQFILNELNINNLLYKVIASGSYDAMSHAEVKYTASINSSELPAEDILTDNINITGTVSGAIQNLNGDINIRAAIKNEELSIGIPVSYTPNAIKIDNIKGSFAQMPILGSLNINLGTGLTLGTVTLNLNNLHSSKNLLGEIKTSGNGKLVAEFKPTKNKQQNITVNLELPNIDYTAMSLNRPSAKLEINDLFNTPHMKLNVKTKNLIYDVISLSKLNLDISSINHEYNLGLSGLDLNNQQFSLNSVVAINNLENIDITIKSLLLKLNKGSIATTGYIKSDALKFDINVSKMALRNLYPELANLPITINKGSASISGTLAKPQLKSNFELSGDLKGLKSAHIFSEINYDQDLLHVILNYKSHATSTLAGELRIPLSLSLQPFDLTFTKDKNLNGNIKSNIEISKIFEEFLSNSSFRPTGNLTSDIAITGTINEPLINGFLKLKAGSLRESYTNIKLIDINAELALKNRNAQIVSMHFKDKAKGKADITGSIDYADLSNPKIDVKAKIKGMKVLETKMIKAVTSADLALVTDNQGYSITGDIDIAEASLNLTDILDQSIPELNIVTKAHPKEEDIKTNINLNLDIKAKNRIFVRGFGVDAELGGSLIVSGPVDEPDLQGKLSALRGRYEEFGKQFTLKNADLIFQGKTPPSPYLDILAQTKSNGVIAKIAITGYLTKPELSLTSDPSLPQDQILSRIMFGENMNDISPIQALQITQSIRRFSGKSSGSSFDPLGKLRSVTKLDDITFEGMGTDDSKVGAGKYLSEKVYVKVEQGKTMQSGTANIEYEVKENVYLESNVSATGALGAGVSWGWDY